MNPVEYQAKFWLASYRQSISYRCAKYGAEFAFFVADSNLNLFKPQIS